MTSEEVVKPFEGKEIKTITVEEDIHGNPMEVFIEFKGDSLTGGALRIKAAIVTDFSPEGEKYYPSLALYRSK